MHHFISFAFSLLAIIGLHVSVQSTGRRSERSIERHFVSLLTVSNGMEWGSWGQREFCPTRTYAAGFSLMVEERRFLDNTALNGIRLYCVSQTKDSSESNEDTSVQSDVGSWGKWTDIKWCPSGFLTAFQLRVQPSREFKDNTAANNIRFNCSQGSLLQGDGTDWGEWGDWSALCQGRGMCGIRTRIEEPQGFFGDDTALNDVRMFCCE
ncbi:vitelline membrane outer layer protein 1-like [Ctenopharyngodon idella]|uniref:vitelline membrane outer layer protein 1-like n=1 Tax=Ctenopharyngodon idella TaxID=7959 RepID=UPI002232BEB3|nr:vitelline membrane outer layer protein 1-like [Ctenopharyngodon idella]